MMGTELDTAYFDSSLDAQSHMDTMIPSEKSPNQNEMPEQPKIVAQEYIREFNPIDKKAQSGAIDELKKQLKYQQELNMAYQKDAVSIYERFASKKKDVMKLLAISLTVLLAISTNFVMCDLIKKYLMNNDFSDNKETLIKLMYPLTTFLLLWSTKVFNK